MKSRDYYPLFDETMLPVTYAYNIIGPSLFASIIDLTIMHELSDLFELHSIPFELTKIIQHYIWYQYLLY